MNFILFNFFVNLFVLKIFQKNTFFHKTQCVSAPNFDNTRARDVICVFLVLYFEYNFYPFLVRNVRRSDEPILNGDDKRLIFAEPCFLS